MNDRNNQYAQSMFTNMQNSEGGFFNNNPPPKLGEKSITENGTYTAKEDKLDGYSSVTVDVDSTFSEMACPIGFYTNNDIEFYNSRIFRSQNGVYDVRFTGAPTNLNNLIMVLVEPLVSISRLSVINSGAIMIFTPAQQCDIATQVELTGDEIENGDGKGYAIRFSRGVSLTGTVYKIIDSDSQHIDWNTDVIIK